MYYEEQRVKYEKYIKGNEFVTIPEALYAINTRTISLLTTDIKSRKLIGVSREAMEEAAKSLRIAPKILARRINALWDLLLATEQEAKALTGNILTTATLRLQTDYMGTRRTKNHGAWRTC